jgi:hypothetical protein
VFPVLFVDLVRIEKCAGGRNTYLKERKETKTVDGRRLELIIRFNSRRNVPVYDSKEDMELISFMVASVVPEQIDCGSIVRLAHV